MDAFIRYATWVARPQDCLACDFLEDFVDVHTRDSQNNMRKRCSTPLDSWDALKSYLHRQGACEGCIEGAHIVWRNFKRWETA